MYLFTDPVLAHQRGRLLELLKTLSFARREVVLASGRRSDFYIDCKHVSLHAEGQFLIGQLVSTVIADVAPKARAVGGLTVGADPLVSATSLVSFVAGRPLHGFIVRKEPKGHGTGQWLEGRKNLPPGSRVVIVEDVTTTGGSSMKAVERAQQEGLTVLGIITLVDREEGARENIEDQGQVLKSVFTRSEVVG